MKTLLISLAAALFAVAGSAHAGADPSAAAPMAAGKTGDGHAHEHGHGDADAIGVPGVAAKVSRTINVDMSDAMRFTPSSISAKQGLLALM